MAISVSLIVLTKNSVATVDKCLESVYQQTCQPNEVIIVDGDSTDGTLEVVNKYPINLVTEPGLGYGYARNLGIKNAKGDIVAFVDSDCILEKNYLEQLISALNSLGNGVGGVGGVTYSVGGNLISESYNVRLFGYSPSNETKIREIESIGGGVALYPRELLNKIGGFDVNIRGGEDHDLNLRLKKAGYRVFLVPNAKSYHFHPSSLKNLSKKWYSYGKFLVDVSTKHNLKNEVMLSWSWILGCLLLTVIAVFTNEALVGVAALLFFWFPWLLNYGKHTANFIVKNPKAKYLLIPFIHQVAIISRSLGVISATLGVISKTKSRLHYSSLY